MPGLQRIYPNGCERTRGINTLNPLLFLSGIGRRIATSHVWLVASIPATFLRLPLIFLPGIGRDEATYLYWSFHWEPAYSPLLQLFTRLFMLLPGNLLPYYRLTSFVSGILVLFLFDRLLLQRRIRPEWRLIALITLAVTPWQTYAGAVLHPDNLLLVALILQVLAIRANKPILIALTTLAGIAAKLSGIVLLPVACYCLMQNWRQKAFLNLIAIIVLTGGLLFMAVLIPIGMLQAVSEFGKLGPDVSLLTTIVVQLLTILLLAGITMPILAHHGLWQQLQFSRDSANRKEAVALVLLSSTILVFFVGAVVISGQVKGNWVLPAFVVLWPATVSAKWQRLVRYGSLVSFLMSLLAVLFFVYPGMIGKIEQTTAILSGSYRLQAGQREARVSRSGSWEQRLREYQRQDVFMGNIHKAIESDVLPQRVGWIVSDDYGLAAQIWFYLGDPEIRIIIVRDQLFVRSLPQESATQLAGKALVVAVHKPIETLWERLPNRYGEQNLRHPLQTGLVEIGFSNGKLAPDPHWQSVEQAKNSILCHWIKVLFSP